MLDSSTIEVFETVTSTMDVARENIQSGRVTFDPGGIPSLCGVMAYEQTAGRGQRGRNWFAKSGESLCVTYYIRHQITLPARAGRVALMAGVACASQIHALCLRHQLPLPALKWPNDVLLNGKKAGGVLVEMVKAPDGKWAVLAGVGLNVYVRDFPSDLTASATSLQLEAGSENTLPTLTELAVSIGVSLTTEAAMSHKHRDRNTIYYWKTYDGTTGRKYETDRDGETVTGTAAGIDDDGALLLRLETGEQIAVTSASSLRECA